MTKMSTPALPLSLLLSLVCGSAIAKIPVAGEYIHEDRQEIINGDYTVYEPWMMALVFNIDSDEYSPSQLQFCGGTLISSQWVLTAAHCVLRNSAEDLALAAGSNNLDSGDIELLKVERIVLHPFYDGGANDIALLKLTEPTEDYTPIELFEAGQESLLIDQLAAAYGWGMTDTSGPECTLNFSDPDVDESEYTCSLIDSESLSRPQQVNLLKTDLTILSPADCEAQIEIILESLGIASDGDETAADGDNANEDSIICTEDIQEASGACFGDSGGPLIAHVNGQQFLVGVVSGGITVGDCNPDEGIGLFTRTSYFLDFIDDVIGRNEALDFDSLCPDTPTLAVEYAEGNNDLILTTLSWDGATDVTKYLFHYASYPDPEGQIVLLEVEAGVNELSVELRPDETLYVSVQAFNAYCNSGLSNLVPVVPAL
ncbi:MAG: serine protease [Pseudohongiellaceae bacterium]